LFPILCNFIIFLSFLKGNKMKCKRCRNQVPDDADVCPHCGEDLSSLRQLLRNFYEEEAARSELSGDPPRLTVDLLKETEEENPKDSDLPRVILNRDDPEGAGRFSVQGALETAEMNEELPETGSWDRALRGGFWQRYMAFAIDSLILFFVIVIFILLGFVAVEWGSAGGRALPFLRQVRIILPIFLPLGFVLAISYFTIFHGAGGQTIGKMILGLRVVQTDGRPLSFFRALGRALLYAVSAFPFFLGFYWAGLTSKKLAWHDRIAGTMVVREQ
jgi:uncharacterized RDD family membrane protein YckC